MNVLFVCYANSVRSQLAEALARKKFPEWNIMSAGARATAVHPAVFELVETLGGDPSQHYSKAVYEMDLDSIDVVVRLCAEPVIEKFPSHIREIVWELPDPGRAGVVASSEEEFISLLRERVNLLLQELSDEADTM